MSYNFDHKIDRSHTGSVKWEFVPDWNDPDEKNWINACKAQSQIIPMWVADMDFACPEPVLSALKQRVDHGIFGYTHSDSGDLAAIVDWMKKRHGWRIQKDWIVSTPGVVPALHMLVRALTHPGDKVLIQQPVYYPFFSAIKNNDCRIVSNSLVLTDNRYHMDFDDLEVTTADPKVKLAILCSPHNPVGRVWTTEELHRFGHICRRNQVLIIADEIHADLIYPGYRFIPFAMTDPVFAQNSIICTAPSKTFNLAGLQTSNIVIADETIRSKFERVIRANGMFGVNPFGMTACRAVYEKGEKWLEALLQYLNENLNALVAYFSQKIPKIKVVKPEGTYLVWLDCRSLGLDNRQLNDLFLRQAGVCLDPGGLFGPEGNGFQRINIACPRSLMMEALERIAKAVKNIRTES
jgi:cystathionine beta-lyase